MLLVGPAGAGGLPYPSWGLRCLRGAPWRDVRVSRLQDLAEGRRDRTAVAICRVGLRVCPAIWMRKLDLNQRQAEYESAALPG